LDNEHSERWCQQVSHSRQKFDI